MLMKLFFRDDRAAYSPAGQPVSGDTIHEMLNPAVLLRDGDHAVGSPWETQYLHRSDVWARGKQGELPGYRSSVLLVEELKLGAFTSALVSDVPSATVWTEEVVEILVPALIEALHRLRAPASLPAGAHQLTGRYFDGVSVSIEHSSTLVLRLSPHASPLNLTLVDEISTPTRRIFRAHPAHSSADCRHLDDGVDFEFAYFTLPSAGANATRLRFMDGLFERDGRD